VGRRSAILSGVAHLFVYGTLLPGEVRWHHLEPFVADAGVADSAAGDLFDTGCGYPAARFGGDRTIHGHTFPLRSSLIDEALRVLDEVEGAVAGLYVRTRVATGRGLVVWSYEYGDGLALEPIRSGSWRAHRTGGAPD